MIKTEENKKWIEEEDWRINVWSPDGELIIKDGESTQKIL